MVVVIAVAPSSREAGVGSRSLHGATSVVARSSFRVVWSPFLRARRRSAARCRSDAIRVQRRSRNDPIPETIRQVARVFKVFKLVKFMANATGGTSEFAEVLEETLFTSAMADYLKVHE
jgi:hypothetical protein